MKKTIVALVAFAFLFSAMGTMAQDKKESKYDKPSKAKDVKILKKNVLSEKDRKKFDDYEELLKGKPTKPSPVPDSDDSEIWATGTVGTLFDEMEGNKYAIVIGLANYPGTEYDLCVSDAKTVYDDPESAFTDENLKYYCKDQDSLDMEKTLREEYGFSDIRIFTDADATYDNIKSAVDEIVPNLKPEDEMVFFFSGHGATREDEDGDVEFDGLDEGIIIYDQDYHEEDFIAEDGSELDSPEYSFSDASYIWDDQLREWFDEADTDRIFFYFDTCGAGGMNDLEGDGRVLAFSSKEGQSSSTYRLGGVQTDDNVIQESSGLFTHYFVLRGMYDGYADGYNPLKKNSKDPLKYDGKVTIEEAFGYTFPIVKYKQTPVLNDRFENDLLL